MIISPALQILKEACEIYGFQFRLVDKHAGYLAEISKNNASFITGDGLVPRYPINPLGIHLTLRDKAFTYLLLQEKGYSIPQGDYFFLRPEYKELRNNGKEFSDALVYAQKLSYPVFVKPNASSGGKGAQSVYNEKALTSALNDIANYDHIALIQKVVIGKEFRIFILNGEIQYYYEKLYPTINGDGETSIIKLIKQKYPDAESILVSSFFQHLLSIKSYTAETILKKGEQLILSHMRNGGSGGKIINVKLEASETLKNWAKEISQKFQLRICGIDLIVPESLEDTDSIVILEMNGDPSLKSLYKMGYKDLVYGIWKKILDTYFQENLCK